MNDLSLILSSSPTLRMALSELLFKELWPDRCFHKVWSMEECPAWSSIYICKKCEIPDDEFGVTDLFLDWTGFGLVFEAVKDREDWQERFCTEYMIHDGLINTSFIAVPLFPLKVLEWLNLEGLERVMKEERKKEGEG